MPLPVWAFVLIIVVVVLASLFVVIAVAIGRFLGSQFETQVRVHDVEGTNGGSLI